VIDPQNRLVRLSRNVLTQPRTRSGEFFGKRISAHLFYQTLNRISDFDIPAYPGDFRVLGRKAA
jgi:hypothetical protein